MKPKFNINDSVKGIGKNSDLEGVIVDLSYSEDFPWTIYNRSYVHPHYKVAIELSNNRGRISWFNERCFILVSEHKTLLEVEK